jgi:hypothetical protein
MTRKRVLWLIAIAALAAAGVALNLLRARPEPGMTKANFDRIRRGMTAAEVEALLGATPAWVMEAGPRRLVRYEVRAPGQFIPDVLVRVMYDDGGRVFDKTWSGPVPPPPPTLFQRVRRLLWEEELVRDG